jgi:hypothetical protein
MRKISLALFLIMVLINWAPAHAQADQPQFVDPQLAYKFGKSLLFSVRLEPAAPIQEAKLFASNENGQSLLVADAVFDQNGRIQYNHLIPPGSLQPFTKIFFNFKITLQDGQVLDSPFYSGEYTDDRFVWQVSNDPQFTVSWIEGNAAFAQAAVETARRGIEQLQQYIPIDSSQPVEIYIYNSASDLQSAFNLNGQQWVAGMARPDFNVAMVSIPPGAEQKLEMERQIPHELAHVMLYRMTGDRYAAQPLWLREGLASLAELSPNPDYALTLENASRDGKLIPIKDLCESFPTDTATALLAYAQSESFVRYIFQTYGASGLKTLINAHAEGLNCEQGVFRSLGQTLSNLESSWRRDVLGEDVVSTAVKNLLPFAILLGMILLIPLILIFTGRKRKPNGR